MGVGSHADANRMLVTCSQRHRGATEAPAGGNVACCEGNSRFDRKKISDCAGSLHQGSLMPAGPPSTRRMTYRGAAEVTAAGKVAYLKRKGRF